MIKTRTCALVNDSHQSTLSFQKLTCFYIQSPETTHHIIAYGLKITLKNNKAVFKYGRANGENS